MAVGDVQGRVELVDASHQQGQCIVRDGHGHGSTSNGSPGISISERPLSQRTPICMVSSLVHWPSQSTVPSGAVMACRYRVSPNPFGHQKLINRMETVLDEREGDPGVVVDSVIGSLCLTLATAIQRLIGDYLP